MLLMIFVNRYQPEIVLFHCKSFIHHYFQTNYIFNCAIYFRFSISNLICTIKCTGKTLFYFQIICFQLKASIKWTNTFFKSTKIAFSIIKAFDLTVSCAAGNEAVLKMRTQKNCFEKKVHQFCMFRGLCTWFGSEPKKWHFKIAPILFMLLWQLLNKLFNI